MGAGGLEDSVANVLRLERVAESRAARFAFADGDEEIGNLVGECLGIADLQARDPPIFHVGLVAIRDVHAAPTAHDALVAVIEVLQTMKIMEVPPDRGVLAIDLKGVERL